MPPRERAVDRGSRIARHDLARIGAELRTARIAHGLTLAAVGHAVGMSPWQVGRIERATLPSAALAQVARIGAVVGLDVRLRAFPGPAPIRDAGHAALIGRFRGRLHPALRLRLEVPVVAVLDPRQRVLDQRAWDGVLSGWIDDPTEFPVEFDPRLHDLQAQSRRIALKRRDGGATAVLWVVAGTRSNRIAARELRLLDPEAFPVTTRAALRHLACGTRPPGSALVLL